jgi:iron complex outermembrane recepter protein
MLITCSGVRRYEFALSVCMLLVFLFLSVGKVRAADLNRELLLDIPEGTSLEQTLLDLVPRVGLQLSVPTTYVAGHRTPRLEGTYTLASALATLLKESGLSYKIMGKTLYVFPTRQLPEATRHRKRILPNTTGGLAAPPMDEVKITTGTHIRDNSTPPGARTVDRRDFDEANFQTLGEVVRSLPSSFPGGLNPGVSPAAEGSQNTASVSGASSANLFGMGSSSTLTLLNGQRIATAEASGAVDLTLLPISVVDRIDVLPGGASAVYGSDAVAGTVNVVLRTDYQGLEMKSALGRSIDGGGFLQHYSLIGGGAWDQGNSFAALDCAWQRAIDSTQRSFLPTGG